MADKMITIRMTEKEAERLQLGLADLLCWVSGFVAAREGTDLAGEEPMGRQQTRDMSAKLLDAMDEAEDATVGLQHMRYLITTLESGSTSLATMQKYGRDAAAMLRTIAASSGYVL
ncbi:hypothetical protein SAMN05444339_10234 [Loktanella atrilutea]|uniref:Uncharacterized protein n=1 Tax=Loktanella atrilutea TaxID=366533 RepID=A0A1M4W945_LOKAT|nr:hypothetical protein [Loktanella atrilutea]SHE77781.1 hypothetical protein SAMN05444339_10234 [Loktanella atrilutea]